MKTINQFHYARVLILLNLIILGSCCDKIRRTCTSSAPSSEEYARFIEPKNNKGFDLQWSKYQQSNDLLVEAQALLGNGITANTLTDWDKAYLSALHFNTLTNEGFIEPNVDVETKMEVPEVPPSESQNCSPDNWRNKYNDIWPHPNKKYPWHLDNTHAQLTDAKAWVKKNAPIGRIVRIAHLDTGYDSTHISFPKAFVRFDLQRNFLENGEHLMDARDPNKKEGLLSFPGHGTGSLALLAGKTGCMKDYGHEGALGLDYQFEIVPIRIANTVILLKSKAFVEAMEYVISLYDNPKTRIHIVSMCMGGVASDAWADVVNRAYEKGIIIVTAAGNNCGGFPTRQQIYPARFHRVLGAVGASYDFSPYKKDTSILQGNYGPERLMNDAIAAFSPNISWAKIGCEQFFSFTGGGTTSATSQVAQAVALYYLGHYDALEKYEKGYQKVEAVRYALFEAAKASPVPASYQSQRKLYYGNGILKAYDALQIVPPPANTLKMQPEDSADFPLFTLLFKNNIKSNDNESIRHLMDVEVQQLVLTDSALQSILGDEMVGFEEVLAQNQSKQKELLKQLAQHEKASQILKKYAREALNNF
jgi:hypothetical protein